MKKILFIEDEPEQVMMIKMRLEANGYEFISAMNGEEGVKKAKKEKPDLILLDLLLSKMNGFEIAKLLRMDDETRTIPIIVITASNNIDLRNGCASVGVCDFIEKPYDAKDLLNRVGKYLK